MAKALKDSITALGNYVRAARSQMDKMFSATSNAGTRAVPAQTEKNDQKYGIRLDRGDVHTKDGKTFRRFKVQANKQASNPTIKSLASADSHKVYAVADLQIDPAPKNTDQAIGDLFEELKKNVKV